MSVAMPPAVPLADLWGWTAHPLRLLSAGAAAGPVFPLRLWRRVLVGYRPDWNRAVLGDLDTFRSVGSLSGLTPYLAAGIVHTDAPEHHPRRRQLNRHFSTRALAALSDRLAELAVRYRPAETFEASRWSATLVRRMLNAALFGSALPDALLARFLAPLDRRLPAPLLPRPRIFSRLDAAIATVLAAPPPGCVAAQLVGAPDAVEQLRTALAAGYDTTAHTLAWAAWHLAGETDDRYRTEPDPLIDEVLRLYPAGWIGSRVAARDTGCAGVPVPAGTMVLYSPYLTHRDPSLWPDPTAFRPDRFADGRPSWSYLPFAAGPRTCLGAHLARLMLRRALDPLRAPAFRQGTGDPAPRAGLTLRPGGRLLVEVDHARLRPARRSVSAGGR
ncbi:cytochrome P450 [Actinocatenispora thailandica]|uniref:Cytochrome P450 n=1 Tax=Actinocatenispora thailandica TaxID=227318 RepID=A0A7R7DXK6_9ACTN|nr:cytochrome P450 [Actinocatenispora thailandica]BCJ39257.1 cytochrome P450 [Actinocatenispora thailandica]